MKDRFDSECTLQPTDPENRARMGLGRRPDGPLTERVLRRILGMFLDAFLDGARRIEGSVIARHPKGTRGGEGSAADRFEALHRAVEADLIRLASRHGRSLRYPRTAWPAFRAIQEEWGYARPVHALRRLLPDHIGSLKEFLNHGGRGPVEEILPHYHAAWERMLGFLRVEEERERRRSRMEDPIPAEIAKQEGTE